MSSHSSASAAAIAAQTQPAPRPVAGSISRPERIQALDYVKGALVLFMVLYHWLNYFHGMRDDIYRYIRFLTPSFIFITGFLIANVYLSKYKSADSRVPRRLLERGLKILGVFTGLNLAITYLLPSNGRVFFDISSLPAIVSVFIGGNTLIPGVGKTAAFGVLVPISYLLVFSSGLLIINRFFPYTFHVMCGLSFLGVFILHLDGTASANVDLLAIGLLGVVVGHLDLTTMNRVIRHPSILLAAYGCYLAAITVWNVIYPLQVAGVCLTLIILYWMGMKEVGTQSAVRTVVLLGKYSLYAYITQIAIVQMLYRGLRPFNPGLILLGLSFVAAFALTIWSVIAIDRARKKVTVVDKLYKAVFA